MRTGTGAVINYEMSINIMDLVESLVELPREELVYFVKQLDQRFADWDLTNDLIDYFKEQEKIFDREVREYGI